MPTPAKTGVCYTSLNGATVLAVVDFVELAVDNLD